MKQVHPSSKTRSNKSHDSGNYVADSPKIDDGDFSCRIKIRDQFKVYKDISGRDRNVGHEGTHCIVYLFHAQFLQDKENTLVNVWASFSKIEKALTKILGSLNTMKKAVEDMKAPLTSAKEVHEEEEVKP